MSKSGCETRIATCKLRVAAPVDIVVLAFPKAKWQERDSNKSREVFVSSWASQILQVRPEQAVPNKRRSTKPATRKAKKAKKAKQADSGPDAEMEDAVQQQQVLLTVYSLCAF